MEELWQLVAARRRAAGITQQELAERAGLSLGAVRDIEQGRTKRPRPAAARRLFDALGLAEADLAPYFADRPRLQGWRFRVLGDLTVSFDDRTLDPGPPKQRAVLAVLALSPNTLIHRDVIADAVWNGSPPSTPARLIPTYLSQLRQALNPHPSRRPQRNLLISEGPRYRLAVTDAEHDLLEFRRLTRQAGAAAAQGDPAAAATLYEQALRLFRDEPVADLDSLQSLPEVAAIRIERTTAVLAFADTALAVGRHQAVLPHLRVAAETEPLHGGVQARLMLALAADGQISVALRHFQDVRRRLIDELGMEPGGELVAAHQQILRQEPVTAGAAPVVPAQLPADTADFTGRSAETARLHRMFSETRSATLVCAITGPGGIGKTTLAVHLAHQVRHQFPDGQLYVDLHGASSAPVPPSEALADMLRALGVAPNALPHTERERAAKFRSLLADRRVLVVLDNVRDPAQVRPLLPGATGCAVLVTSRHSMTVLPGVRLCRLEPLADADAATFLCRVADVEPGSTEASAADRLARLCGGLPLALRVAGARAAEHGGLAKVADRLAGEARLHELELDDLSVAATFGVSIDLLQRAHDHSAELFRRLGLFEGIDVSAPIAARILDTTEALAKKALGHLVRVHLANRTPSGLYGMHDLLRLYAAEQAAAMDSNTRSAIMHRVVRWYLATARRAAMVVRPAMELWHDEPAGDPCHEISSPAEAVAWVEAERDNLFTIVRRALAESSLNECGLLLVEALSWAFTQQGYSEQWEKNLLSARRVAAQLGDLRKEAAVLHWLGRIASTYDPQTCIAYYEEALRLSRIAGDRRNTASILGNLGVEHHQAGHLREATKLYKEAQEHAHGHDPRTEGYALANLAAVSRDLGRIDEAVSYDQQAIEVAREIGDRQLELDATDDLGGTRREAGDLDAALAAHNAALALAHFLKDARREAMVLANLGSTLLARRDTAKAVETLKKAASSFDALGDLPEIGRTLRLLGEAYQNAGDQAAMRDCLERALEVLEKLGVPDADEVRALLERLA